MASQIRTVLSRDPETMRVPSGENATDQTQPECPHRGPLMGAPDAASQIRTVRPQSLRQHKCRREKIQPTRQGKSAPAEGCRLVHLIRHPKFVLFCPKSLRQYACR